MDYERRHQPGDGREDDVYPPSPPPYRDDTYPVSPLPYAEEVDPPEPRRYRRERDYADVRRSGYRPRRPPKGTNPVLVLVMVAGVLLVIGGAVVVGILFAVGVFNQDATVHLDNYSTQDVAIEVDGKPWHRVAQGRTSKATLKRGSHEIVVKDASTQAQLDRLTVKVDGSGPYILNVLGAQTYQKGEAWYEVVPIMGGLGEPPPVAVRDKWIHAKVDYLFQEPPMSIQLPRHSTRATKTYLVRGTVPPVRPGIPPVVPPVFNQPGVNNPGFNPPPGANPWNDPVPPPAPPVAVD